MYTTLGAERRGCDQDRDESDRTQSGDDQRASEGALRPPKLSSLSFADPPRPPVQRDLTNPSVAITQTAPATKSKSSTVKSKSSNKGKSRDIADSPPQDNTAVAGPSELSRHKDIPSITTPASSAPLTTLPASLAALSSSVTTAAPTSLPSFTLQDINNAHNHVLNVVRNPRTSPSSQSEAPPAPHTAHIHTSSAASPPKKRTRVATPAAPLTSTTSLPDVDAVDSFIRSARSLLAPPPPSRPALIHSLPAKPIPSPASPRRTPQHSSMFAAPRPTGRSAHTTPHPSTDALRTTISTPRNGTQSANPPRAASHSSTISRSSHSPYAEPPPTTCTFTEAEMAALFSEYGSRLLAETGLGRFPPNVTPPFAGAGPQDPRRASAPWPSTTPLHNADLGAPPPRSTGCHGLNPPAPLLPPSAPPDPWTHYSQAGAHGYTRTYPYPGPGDFASTLFNAAAPPSLARARRHNHILALSMPYPALPPIRTSWVKLAHSTPTRSSFRRRSYSFCVAVGGIISLSMPSRMTPAAARPSKLPNPKAVPYKLDRSDWVEAVGNFLSALDDHLIMCAPGSPSDPDAEFVIASFCQHFDLLQKRADFKAHFTTYVLYDIFVRRQWLSRRRAGKARVPLETFQVDVFAKLERERNDLLISNLSNSFAAATAAQKSFRPSSSGSSTTARASQDRAPSKKGEAHSSKPRGSHPYNADRDKGPVLCITSQRVPTTSGATPPVTSSATLTTAPTAALAATPAPTSTLARSVELHSILRNTVLRELYFPVSTPLKHWRWSALLEETGGLSQFAEVPKGLQHGFSLGLEDFILDHTFSPPNHYKTPAHHAFILSKYTSEIKLGRVSPGYPPSLLTSLFGHFRTAPLNVIERTTGKLRITVDHSFPRNDPHIPSVNSQIDSKRFQCAWGTFSTCYLLVADAPPGTEACVFDVDSAFRNIPTRPEDRTATAILINGLVHLDGRLNFGICPAPGIFGLVADAIVWIYLHKGIEAVIKWVDDFIFFRYRHGFRADGSPAYSYSESLIWAIARDLGWPWAPEKFKPFAPSFTYIGFEWCLTTKTVRLPLAKRQKYLAKLAWLPRAPISLATTESLIGTLNHVTLVIPEGRSHLPALFKFRAGFHSSSPSWTLHRVTPDVSIEIAWWTDQLSNSWCGLDIVRPPPPLDLPIFVDASTSWGIGFFLNGKWLAWKLLPGWKSDDRDIGWAEMVAVDLALRACISSGLRDCHIVIRSDNSGVVGALAAGRSRNSQQNAILRRIVDNFQSNKIWITTSWVSTHDNIADAPSRGRFPPRNTLFPFPPALPSYLKPYVAPSVPFHALSS
ncbi:hypothetical protein D9615_008035 [Tricholomella constricta]|uniref:Uncharacterized protein n=1 Tax=Tricholomella constricta TaxID=117010 RepID=A0A8H5GW79_9AGAR|nr:hypothetical protein D9615_008035 [Tricholomella constricta]